MSKLYNAGLGSLLDGTVSWLNGDIQAMVLSGNVFNDNDEYVADVVTDEVTNAIGTGYERKVLFGKTVTVDQANDRVTFDATDLSFTGVETNETWDAVAIYDNTGSDATSRLICYLDIDTSVTNGSDASVTFSASGVFRINNT